MKKKIISLITIVALIASMALSVFATNGETWETWDANGANITLSYTNSGTYTLGEYLEFSSDTYCSGSKGVEGTREFSVEPYTGYNNAISDIQYLDGENWKNISEYNVKISLANDLGRRFRMRFTENGVYVVRLRFTATDNSMGIACAPRYVSIENGEYSVSKKEPVPETRIEETESPTGEIETTTDIIEPSTNVTETTKAATVNDKVIIKKIATKKKSAKKITITINKLKNVTGYQAFAYKTKANANKNKKAIASVTTKKNAAKIILKNKKLKNQKKLFIRVRGYKKINGVTTYLAWSKVTKVKITK